MSTWAIAVTLTRTAGGTRSATVVITYNGPTSPHSMSLRGSSTAASASVPLSPTSLSYGSQLVGTTSAAQTITVTSTGTAPLSISSIAVGGANSGNFAQTSN